MGAREAGEAAGDGQAGAPSRGAAPAPRPSAPVETLALDRKAIAPPRLRVGADLPVCQGPCPPRRVGVGRPTITRGRPRARAIPSHNPSLTGSRRTTSERTGISPNKTVERLGEDKVGRDSFLGELVSVPVVSEGTVSGRDRSTSLRLMRKLSAVVGEGSVKGRSRHRHCDVSEH